VISEQPALLQELPQERPQLHVLMAITVPSILTQPLCSSASLEPKETEEELDRGNNVPLVHLDSSVLELQLPRWTALKGSIAIGIRFMNRKLTVLKVTIRWLEATLQVAPSAKLATIALKQEHPSSTAP
jgi:hypothetical protein